MYGIIYLLKSPEGKSYIGQTTKTLEHRWSTHKSKAINGDLKGCRYLYAAIRKYGPDSFERKVITACESKEQLDAAEQMYINCLKANLPEFGYNLQGGGYRGKQNEESKRKISAFFTGKQRPVEVREKLSAAKLGEKNPMFGKKPIAGFEPGQIPWNKGKHFSDEARKHMSEARKGLLVGEKHPNWGKHRSQETKDKISLTKFLKTVAWG